MLVTFVYFIDLLIYRYFISSEMNSSSLSSLALIFIHIFFKILKDYQLSFSQILKMTFFFWQCPSGHTFCSVCKSRVNNKCPICRKDIGNIRCLALEKLAVSLCLPCAYHQLGCEQMLPYYSKVVHEAQCAYKPYSCPHPGPNCPFTGGVSAVLSHLQDGHEVDLQYGSTFNHRYVKQDPCSVDDVTWTLTVSYFKLPLKNIDLWACFLCINMKIMIKY